MSESRKNLNLVGEKHHCAKEYMITTPYGENITIKGLNKFCKENNLLPSCMSLLAQGKQEKPHKGYMCKYYNQGVQPGSGTTGQVL